MRRCPQCGSSFRGTPARCPLDGAPLAEGGDPRLGREVGPWRLVETLSEGRLATVYRAARGELEGALKLYEATAPLRRGRQEAESLGRVQHASVARLLDAGETERGEPYLVTELVKGRSLRARLTEGPLPWRQALRLAAAMADGLEAVHGAGLVHRDLKPENVMLVGATPTRADGVKLLDLGHALVLDVARLTESGMVWGSAPYMSPEQAAGLPVDRRSDLYALGVMVYELVVGRRPFEARSPMELMQLHWTQAPTPPARVARVPEPLSELCLWLLAKRPEARPPSARVVAAACRGLEAEPFEEELGRATRGARLEGTHA
ncbi:MAG: serine/threonine protein kinase [Deltaproteobacteria bacterium]|nr:serine/threonine protein kinase [Deltaproteobacteria bacterium]